MKTLHLSILAVFLVFAGLMLSYDNTAYGIWVRQSPQELLNDSTTIFVGNITSVNVLQFEKETSDIIEENGIEKNVVKNYTLSLDEYNVNIEEFLKNPQIANKITVRQPITSLYPGMLGGLDEFHAGDRVLFYIKNLDGNNTYSPESFIIPKSCVATNVLTQNRLVARGESFEIQNGIKVDRNFTANESIQFVDNEDVGTLSGKSLDTMVQITKNTGSNAEVVFSKEIPSEAKPCEWIASAEWEFTPQEGEYRMYVTMAEDNKTYAQYSSKFSVKSDVATPDYVSPLKQFQSGVALKDIMCAPDFQLVIKAKSRSPACVKPDDVSKLVERGWADKPNSLQEQIDFANVCLGMNDACRNRYDMKNSDPFGITALIIYHPPDSCLSSSSHSTPSGLPICPPNKFYLKINSNSTAYLMGYNICDGNTCAVNNTISLALPLNTGLHPDYQMIGLPVTLSWQYEDTVGIKLRVSSTDDNKTASLIDLGDSKIVP